jgi:hypothetical protein
MLRPAGPEASGACGSSGGENAAVSLTRSNESRSRYGFSSAACAVVALAGLIVPASNGERMAVPWLDLARFADTVGYHGDQGQRIFPYRDYVIDSFNRKKPFDQFTVEQLAWGGEFGRTPMGQGSGRDHHILGFSIWMAGGGIKGG